MVTHLCRHDRSMLLDMLRMVLHDPSCTGILADWLEDRDEPAAFRLREHPDTLGWLAVLAVGGWRCQAVSCRARGCIRRYALAVYRSRQVGGWFPDGSDPNQHFWVPARLEMAGFPQTGPDSIGATDNIAQFMHCYRLDHVTRLVWHGLHGHAVPPDVETGLVDLREQIRVVILTENF